ncbi:MAG: UDP-N-acetylglucosamine 2-epimerase (non-hydrolyzing), partial [Bacilli bacterium]|nr:UDP-N-acetylglucosamine 2-epimerase (non-hydrolyzing) [Bacilli bacterium]
IKNILDNKKEYKKMTKAINPYGDGNASKKIVEILHMIKNGAI